MSGPTRPHALHGAWRTSNARRGGRKAPMSSLVVDLRDVDRSQVAIVGGMVASLGEVAGIDGLDVAEGFCVTTDAFRRFVSDAPSIGDGLDRLARLRPDDRDAIRTVSGGVRETLR